MGNAPGRRPTREDAASTGPDVLVTDYYSASNRGDAAILEGVRHALLSALPSADLTVATEHPEAAALVNGIDAVEQPLTDFRWGLTKRNAARALCSATAPLVRRGVEPTGFGRLATRAELRPLLEADLVVSTGGQFLTDVYFPEKVAVLWQHAYLAQLDTPVVLFAQSLGPFERRGYRQLVARTLETTDLILTRDRRSAETVADLGVSTPTCVTADAAFAMPLEDSAATPSGLARLRSDDEWPPEELFRAGRSRSTSGSESSADADPGAVGADCDRPAVTVSVREWTHGSGGVGSGGEGGGGGAGEYVDAIADVADWLVTERGAEVLFASTCTGLAGYHTDDRVIAAEVVEAMGHGDDEAVRILTGEYTPRELVRIYGRADLHVGMRMHSNVLATLAGTPVVPIQYQFKTTGLMEQFDLAEWVLDVEDVTAPRLRRLVADALRQREQLAAAVRETVPTLRARAMRSAELVREHVALPGTADSDRRRVGERPAGRPLEVDR